MKKIFFIFLLFAALHVEAQHNYAYLVWDTNIPLSNTSWIEGTSSKGGKVGYRAFLNNNSRISIGGDVNWVTYDEYSPKETFQTGNGAITTDYFKGIYSYGVTVSGQYYFPINDRELFFPYVGLGLGANFNRYMMYYNIYSSEESKAGFLARPETGILVRFGTRKSLGLMAAVHYDYSTNKSESYGYDNFTAFGFQIGAIFMNRY